MDKIQCCSKTRSQKTVLSDLLYLSAAGAEPMILQSITIELKVEKQSSGGVT